MASGKGKNRILLPVSMLVAGALGFCAIPAINCFAGGETVTSESYIYEDDAILALTDNDIDKLISGEATLEALINTQAATAQSGEAVITSQGDEAAADVEVKASTSEAPGAETAAEEQPAGSAETVNISSEASAASVAQDETYQAEIKALIQQLYAVKARAESGLNSCIAEAKAEYKALPAEQQTQAKKIAICFSKAGQLKSLQASCDAEVESIVSQMRTVLAENGQSTELADQVMSSYNSQKSARYSQLMSQL